MELLGGARALLYPVQAREPFGLVLAEAMACGTPVAALDRGAVREIVDDGVTGGVFDDRRTIWSAGLPRVFALDRRRVRERAVARFGVERMVDGVRGRLPPARVQAHRARRHDREVRQRPVEPLDWPAGPCSACSRIPTTSRWRAAGRWRAWPTPAPAWCCCARRAARAGSISDRRSCPTAISGASAPTSCAQAAARPRRRRGRRSSIIPTATCGGPTCPSSTRRSCSAIRDYRPDAVITFGEDGLYWHLDHIGVHERTDDAVRRSAPPPRRSTT